MAAASLRTSLVVALIACTKTGLEMKIWQFAILTKPWICKSDETKTKDSTMAFAASEQLLFCRLLDEKCEPHHPTSLPCRFCCPQRQNYKRKEKQCGDWEIWATLSVSELQTELWEQTWEQERGAAPAPRLGLAAVAGWEGQPQANRYPEDTEPSCQRNYCFNKPETVSQHDEHMHRLILATNQQIRTTKEPNFYL